MYTIAFFVKQFFFFKKIELKLHNEMRGVLQNLVNENLSTENNHCKSNKTRAKGVCGGTGWKENVLRLSEPLELILRLTRAKIDSNLLGKGVTLTRLALLFPSIHFVYFDISFF